MKFMFLIKEGVRNYEQFYHTADNTVNTKF
jgi:hypothetical protein